MDILNWRTRFSVSIMATNGNANADVQDESIRIGRRNPNEPQDEFYCKGAQYWSGQDASDNGMLGGLGHLSRIELECSEKFLKTIMKAPYASGTGRVIDCGAGIGRISKNLLQRHFSKVDLVDQDPAFIAKAKENLKEIEKIGEFYCSGLQDFTPQPRTYDVIWCQWVLAYLTDDDLLQFFARCRKALLPNGLVIIKENITRGNKSEIDEDDSSVTRAFNVFLDIFKKADFTLLHYVKQKNFPRDLYPVWMFCIKPNSYD